MWSQVLERPLDVTCFRLDLISARPCSDDPQNLEFPLHLLGADQRAVGNFWPAVQVAARASAGTYRVSEPNWHQNRRDVFSLSTSTYANSNRSKVMKECIQSLNMPPSKHDTDCEDVTSVSACVRCRHRRPLADSNLNSVQPRLADVTNSVTCCYRR